MTKEEFNNLCDLRDSTEEKLRNYVDSRIVILEEKLEALLNEKDFSSLSYSYREAQDIVRSLKYCKFDQFSKNRICGEGHEYWSYGGHEHHVYDTTWDELTDEGIEKTVREFKEKIKKEVEDERESKKRRDLAEFERLKKELGK